MKLTAEKVREIEALIKEGWTDDTIRYKAHVALCTVKRVRKEMFKDEAPQRPFCHWCGCFYEHDGRCFLLGDTMFVDTHGKYSECPYRVVEHVSADMVAETLRKVAENERKVKE